MYFETLNIIVLRVAIIKSSYLHNLLTYFILSLPFVLNHINSFLINKKQSFLEIKLNYFLVKNNFESMRYCNSKVSNLFCNLKILLLDFFFKYV